MRHLGHGSLIEGKKTLLGGQAGLSIDGMFRSDPVVRVALRMTRCLRRPDPPAWSGVSQPGRDPVGCVTTGSCYPVGCVTEPHWLPVSGPCHDGISPACRSASGIRTLGSTRTGLSVRPGPDPWGSAELGYRRRCRPGSPLDRTTAIWTTGLSFLPAACPASTFDRRLAAFSAAASSGPARADATSVSVWICPGTVGTA